MLDVLDLEALRLEARSEAERFAQEIALEFLRPLLEAQMVRDVLALPPALRREALKDPRLGPLLKRLLEQAGPLREAGPGGERAAYR